MCLHFKSKKSNAVFARGPWIKVYHWRKGTLELGSIVRPKKRTVTNG